MVRSVHFRTLYALCWSSGPSHSRAPLGFGRRSRSNAHKRVRESRSGALSRFLDVAVVRLPYSVGFVFRPPQGS